MKRSKDKADGFGAYKFEPPSEYKTVEHLCAQAAHYADCLLRRPEGMCAPAVFILSLDEMASFYMWDKPFNSESVEIAFRDTCRIFCIGHAATHAVLCIESWVRGTEYLKDGIMPSEAADRKEVITLLVDVRDQPPQLRVLPILRDGNGKYFGLQPAVILKGRMANSKFYPLLLPTLPPAPIREFARLAMQQGGFKAIGVAPRGKAK